MSRECPLLIVIFAVLSARGAEACTAFAVSASEKGSENEFSSAYAGQNADCANCDGRVAYIAARDYAPCAKRSVYETKLTAPRWVGYGRAKFYEPKDDGNGGDILSSALGEIDQVSHTYGYYEATMPLINDQGLGMGESSCATMLSNVKKGDPNPDKKIEGIFDVISLMQVAMERCATARCAVDLMGDLAETYGYFGNEYAAGRDLERKVPAVDDNAETVTLSDRTGDSWVFHVLGGSTKAGGKAVWAAQRVPKGHVAVVANYFTIRELPLESNEEFRFSKNIREVALAENLWNGRDPFDFTKTFAPNIVSFEVKGKDPLPLYTSLRMWRVFELATGDKYPVYLDPMNYPFSVRIKKEMSAKVPQSWLSDVYQDSEFDMREGILAGPFGNPFRIEGGESLMHDRQIPRALTIPRTFYSIVAESNPFDINKSVAWYAADTPLTSIYIPYIASVSDGVALPYMTGINKKFDRNSAWWAFDFVANYMGAVNFRASYNDIVFPLKKQLQSNIDDKYIDILERNEVNEENKRNLVDKLRNWQLQVQNDVVKRWWELSEELIVRYNDGTTSDPRSTDTMGLNHGYPKWFVNQIGMDHDVHPVIVQRDKLAQIGIFDPSKVDENFKQPEASLPLQWTGMIWEQWLNIVYMGGPMRGMMSRFTARVMNNDDACTFFFAIPLGVLIGFLVARFLYRKEKIDISQPLL